MSLRLEQIAYCSEAKALNPTLLSIAEILAVSDRNNSRDNLTGALLVSRRRFFQVLEGAPQDLDRTLGRIASDPRHHRLQIVLRRPVATRAFGAWAIVAARVSPDRTAEIDAAIDDCQDDPDRAVKLTLDLVQQQIGGRHPTSAMPD